MTLNTTRVALLLVGLFLAAPLSAQGRYDDRARRYPAGPVYRHVGPAYDNGYKDGYDKGRDDARDNDRYNPRRHSRYRKADRGFNKRYGSKEAYRAVYRDGFSAGYADGYRDAEWRARRSRRGTSGRGRRWHW